MLRFLLRMTGYLLIAASFALAVLDGARAIANRALQFTSLLDLLAAGWPARLLDLRGLLARTLPGPLSDASLMALALPAIGFGFGLGFLLLWLGRPRREGIGVLTGR